MAEIFDIDKHDARMALPIIAKRAERIYMDCIKLMIFNGGYTSDRASEMLGNCWDASRLYEERRDKEYLDLEDYFRRAENE